MYIVMIFVLVACFSKEHILTTFTVYFDTDCYIDGAYYYYKTEDGMNYEDTIIALKHHVEEERIPVRWILYDSWSVQSTVSPVNHPASQLVSQCLSVILILPPFSMPYPFNFGTPT